MFCPIVLRGEQLRPPVLNYLTAMARSNSESSASTFDSLSTEYQICRRKLESKCEALLILSRELDQCRSERDQFKLMAEQLRDRYQMVKRQLTGDTPMSSPHVEVDPKTYSDIQTQSLARLLFDTKETNKSLRFEVDDLKQKLHDAEGDIKLLREQIVRSRVGTTDEGLNTRHFPAHEREDLVKQLEVGREEFVQLERDLQQVLDEKEELVTERDAYRTKYERLNMELNYILGGDEKRIVDIDALSMENKFLQERLKQMEEEKTMAMATVTKYKSILEKKKTKGILKLGQSRSGGLVITQKQVQQIMQSRSSITPTPQALADLQGLCGALLDTISDKNLALSHQRKTNKLLGNRVSELEKKLKTLEMSGLWSVSGNFQNLEKLKAECEEIKTLVPRQFSHSTDTSEPARDASDLDSELSSVTNSITTSPSHQKQRLNHLNRLYLEELDLLPTKEEAVKGDSCTEVCTTPGADDTAASSCDILTQGTDITIGMSDLEEESTGRARSRVVLTEAMLKTLLGDNRRETGASGGEWDVSDKDEHESNIWSPVIGEMDSDDRETAILKCLRQDSDDKEEAFNYYDFNGDDEDAEDEEEEVSEEFRSLLESITQKLLQRSHQLGQPQVEQAQQQPQKSPVVDKNVYITDDFDDLQPQADLLREPSGTQPSDDNVYITDDFDDLQPQADLLREPSGTQPSDDSCIPAFSEATCVPSGSSITIQANKTTVDLDNKTMVLNASGTEGRECINDTREPEQIDVSELKNHITNNISTKLSTPSHDEEGDEANKNTLQNLAPSVSGTGENERGDLIHKTLSHKLSASVSDTDEIGQGDKLNTLSIQF